MTDRSAPGAPAGRMLPSAALIIVAALLVLGYQLIVPAYYGQANDDAAIIPKYVPQVLESFRQGNPYPGWMAEDFNGYGSPRFVYYPPLLFVCCSFASMTGIGLPLCIATLKLLCLIAGGMFVYILVRGHFGHKAALVAALCYILLPTRLADLYYINSPAGRFAQVWMPLVMIFAGNLADGGPNRKDLAGFGLAYSALILSHIATAFIFTPFLIAYGVHRARKGRPNAAALGLVLGLITGSCLSAVYFLPFVAERRFIHLDVVNVLFPYWKNYLFNIFHDPGVMYPGVDWSSLRDMIITESAMLAVMYVIARRNAGGILGRDARFFAWAMAASIFMMSSLSGPLWKYVPGLSVVQFSYRFEAVYIIFISALLGSVAVGLDGWRRKSGLNAFITLLLAVAILAYDAKLVAGSISYSGDEAARVAQESHWLDYLPRTVDIETIAALPKDGDRVSSADGVITDIGMWDYELRKFSVDAPSQAEVSVRTYYFPGWRAWVDGAEVTIGIEDKTGAMLLDIPPGRHEVELKFSNTWPRTLGAMVSILTVVLLVFPYGLVRRRTSKSQ